MGSRLSNSRQFSIELSMNELDVDLVDTAYHSLLDNSTRKERLSKNRTVLIGMLVMEFALYIPIALCAPFFPTEAVNNFHIDQDIVGTIFGIYPAAAILASFASPTLLKYLGRVNVLIIGG